MRAPRPKAALAAVAVAALAVAGCAESNRDDESGGSKKDTLVFGVAGDPKVLDPSFASDGESLRVAIRSSRPWSDRGGWHQDRPGPAPSPGRRRRRHDLDLQAPLGREVPRRHRLQRRGRLRQLRPLVQRHRRQPEPGRHAYWQDVFGGFPRTRTPDLPPSLCKSCTAKDATTVDLSFTPASSSKIPAAMTLPAFSMQSPTALQEVQRRQAQRHRGRHRVLRRTPPSTRPAPARSCSSSGSATRRSP